MKTKTNISAKMTIVLCAIFMLINLMLSVSNPNSKAYAYVSEKASLPTYSLKAGGKPVPSGSFTNKEIMYLSNDPNLFRIYYKKPSATNFYLTTAVSYSVTNTNANNGWWYFYATDTLGNKSDEVNIFLDTVKPAGSIYSNGEQIASGSITKLGFNYIATDDGSGIDYLQCKSPKSTEWKTYISGSVIPSTSDNGKYEFRAVDKCGNISTISTISLNSHEHNYSAKTVPPTCTDNGYTRFTCLDCGEHYDTDFTLPSGHLFNSHIVKESKCEEQGMREFTCEKCGNKYEETIPSLGHNYLITEVVENDKNTQRIMTCSRCGDSYVQDLGNQYEKVSSYVEFLFNKYSPYMLWVFLATSGVWSIVLGVMIIIANKHDEKEKAKKMTKNYIIGLIVIFAILVACPFLVRGVAAIIN